MAQVTITNDLGRKLVVDEELYKQYEQFFKGWSLAREPITPRQTFDRVDELKGRTDIDMEIGELFGRVSTWRGLMFLKDEYRASETLYVLLARAYGLV